jgi:hypothetical protein
MMFDCHVRFCHIITINKESFNIFWFWNKSKTLKFLVVVQPNEKTSSYWKFWDGSTWLPPRIYSCPTRYFIKKKYFGIHIYYI